ncbi:hypothetical protein J2Z35_001193 [Acetoanaerobium pronyense]|uniref:Uncharacterized protein n=1 Tax=Acetoanaerobium pronyense TaxID=1482736 RepID=A0ABS4KI16_9FIRM|nr:hypothetical protein [Acetoanaerobium pronyense]MBP2027399.1 hypothetical protein [Acetoanaerobium pronyense]
MEKKNKKLTLNDFIAKAKQKEQGKFKAKAVYVESLEGEIIMQKISASYIVDAMDSITSDDSMRNTISIYKELLYNSVPLLKEKELQEQFDLVEPFDIVEEMFDLGEILELGNEVLKMHGLEDLESNVKN